MLAREEVLDLLLESSRRLHQLLELLGAAAPLADLVAKHADAEEHRKQRRLLGEAGVAEPLPLAARRGGELRLPATMPACRIATGSGGRAA